MSTPVFVLNLKIATKRREFIQKQFDAMQLDFSFFDAVNGVEQKNFPQYNEKKSYNLRSKELTLGELGCYSSHYNMWLKCIELNQPIIILEDDIVIDKKLFLNFYNQIDELSPIFECIRLFKNDHKKYKSAIVKQYNNFRIDVFNVGHVCALGYYITPNGAKKFIENSSEWVRPVDDFMDEFWQNKVTVYGVVEPILAATKGLDSFIDILEPRIKPKRTLAQKILREQNTIIRKSKQYVEYKRILKDINRMFL